MSVITRFAPSPTGELHIGGVRTAIFNWLFAKANGGKFLLRIEDTDQNRSKTEYIKPIIEGLSWLDLNWDDNIVYQSENLDCHVDVVNQLLANNFAYRCYLTEEELQDIDGDTDALRKYRDSDSDNYDHKKPHVVRFKMPLSGSIEFYDSIRGNIKINCCELEDFVILRKDSTATYSLACVVDDYKMKITHVIRGEDHIVNAVKQIALYNAMGWSCPQYAHIPLIHTEEGRKLSKRNGDAGIDYYKEMGILPAAMFNYLLRLGWSHGNDEIISVDNAISWFNLDNVGKSPAKLNITKLLHINSVYIREAADHDIYEILLHKFEKVVDQKYMKTIQAAISILKMRAQTLNDIFEQACNMFGNDLPKYNIEKPEISPEVEDFLMGWDPSMPETEVKSALKEKQIKFKEFAIFMRFALSGAAVSPGVFEIINCLGADFSKYRVDAALRKD